MGSATKTIVVGWHGADWKAIHPLVDAGLMPNLRALIERGVIGSVKAIGPANPAILWTSIATGKHADAHGILSYMERDPLGGAVRPVRSTTRRAKALWNIAMQSGLKAHAVGWSAGHPAEPLNGCCVTNHFPVPVRRVGEPWPLAPGAVSPEHLAAALAEFRVHAGELTGDDILPFIPRLNEIDQETDSRPLAVADVLARTITAHGAATWLLEHKPWDLMMIGWDGLERAAYGFLKYQPPCLPQVSELDCAWYGGVLTGMYSFHDMLLGRLVELAGPEANIVLVSPTGFRTGVERPLAPEWRDSPGAWLRQFGMLAMAGPNIQADKLIHGVTMFDIAPTFLNMLGLPAGADMPGQVISTAFRSAPEIDRIASWEDLPGDCGMHPTETDEELHAAETAIRELKSLGYSDSKLNVQAIALADRDYLLNSALVFLSTARFREARVALEQLVEKAPADNRLRLWLAYTHLLCGERQECRAVLENLDSTGPAAAMANLMLAQVETDPADVVAAVRNALSLGAEIALVQYVAGAIYMQMKMWAEAEPPLRRAIEIDPAYQAAHDLLVRLLTLGGKNTEAVETALAGLEIDFSSAFSHFALGLAMSGSGDHERALKAFERSASLAPELRDARAWAAAIRIRALGRDAVEEQS